MSSVCCTGSCPPGPIMRQRAREYAFGYVAPKFWLSASPLNNITYTMTARTLAVPAAFQNINTFNTASSPNTHLDNGAYLQPRATATGASPSFGNANLIIANNTFYNSNLKPSQYERYWAIPRGLGGAFVPRKYPYYYTPYYTYPYYPAQQYYKGLCPPTGSYVSEQCAKFADCRKDCPSVDECRARVFKSGGTSYCADQICGKPYFADPCGPTNASIDPYHSPAAYAMSSCGPCGQGGNLPYNQATGFAPACDRDYFISNAGLVTPC